MPFSSRTRVISILVSPLLLAAVVSAAFAATSASASTVREIRNQIGSYGEQIQQIEQEIKQYEDDLREIGKEKTTLQNAINSLDVSRRKIGADINLTENKIETTGLEIRKLEIEIGDKETRMAQSRKAIAKAIRTIHEVESDSLIEAVLVHDNLSEVWGRVETLERFQLAMRENIEKLAALKDDLEQNKVQTERKKRELQGYNNQLAGQKRVLDENRQEKNELLAVTKNQESSYQLLLAEKRVAREKFERELRELEAQLEFALDPSSIPPTGQGVLALPLDDPIITQYFGDTPFAKSGGYDGRGHNGVDFRASSGTRAKASLSGTVAGVGNSDKIPGCFSYGKWVLLKHNNGLSTLYAHLSVINVSPGQGVRTGDVIGFSGNTGYSTGPHLHYGVYLSDAVQIVRLGDIKKITNCGPARIPVAPLQAYLNPLDYLVGGRSLPAAI